jgi:hypothetical protein
VKVLVKVGAKEKESLRIPGSYLERETGFESGWTDRPFPTIINNKATILGT